MKTKTLMLLISNGLLCSLSVLSGCSRTEPDASLNHSPSTVSENRVLYTLEKEPEYVSKPLYCKIKVGWDDDKAFFATADIDARVVYFDLNSNGDLTEPGEVFELVETSSFNQTRNWLAVIPSIEQGEDVHTDLKFKFGQTGDDVKAVVSMKLWGWDESTTDADLIPLRLPSEPSAAPTIHFNGPLTMGAYRETTQFRAGNEVDFYSLIGTRGLDGGTLSAITNSEIPDDAHPKAEFTFTNRDPSKPPVKITTYLTTRC